MFSDRQGSRLRPPGAAGQGEPFKMGDRSRTFRKIWPDVRSFLGMVRDVARQNDGVSATEFALLAPLLVLAVLAMADLGMAISERMTIGHILRAGAQSATEDVGPATVNTVLRATAARNMTLAAPNAAGSNTTLALSVRRVCACAAQPAVEVACSTTCAQNAPTQIYYVLSGSKTYAGIILPQFAQSRSLEVQVR